MSKDFTPTKETISLHGLGFIQLVLNTKQRIHVWHPDLPKRKCFEHSSVHNHRFGFTSKILKGTLINELCDIEIVRPSTGSYNLISHNGPRLPTGSRESYPVAECNLIRLRSDTLVSGCVYSINPLQYHRTDCIGPTITLMEKTCETNIHATSVCQKNIKFDVEFDRFQLSPEQLYEYVVDALKG